MKSRTRVALSVILISVFSLAITSESAAEQTITIGASLGMTGPRPIAAASVPLDMALQDCIAIANQKGGINGKKLRYIMKDDQYKPDVGVRVFKELMSAAKPLAVFASGTPVALAVQPLLREQYKVLFTSTSFSAKIAFSGVSSTFVPGPTYGDQVAVALKYIARVKKGAKVALFYSNSELGKDPIPYARIVCRNLRLSLVASVTGDIKGGDHTAQIEELKRKDPDFVILHGWVGPPNAAVIKQCHDMGLKSQIVVTLWGAMKSVVEALGPDGPTFLAVSPYAYWWMDKVPAIRTIKAYTSEHHPEVQTRSLSYMVAFTAGKIFVECLKRADVAGKLTGEGAVMALQTLKDFDTGGLTPPLTIKDNRFPIARILKSNPKLGIFEPLSDWIKFY